MVSILATAHRAILVTVRMSASRIEATMLSEERPFTSSAVRVTWRAGGQGRSIWAGDHPESKPPAFLY